MMPGDVKLIDIASCDLSLSQAMGLILGYTRIMPRHEIFMDGDEYAILARPREVTA